MEMQLSRISRKGLFKNRNQRLSIAYIEDKGFLSFRLEFVIGRSKCLGGLKRHLGTLFIRSEGNRRMGPSEVVGAGKRKTHGQCLAIVLPRQQSHLLLRALFQMNGDGRILRDVPQDSIDVFSADRFIEGIEKSIDSFASETRIGYERF